MNAVNKQNLGALLAGTLFGLGLSISGMSDPGRVIGFLDVTGAWDPTLLFVMGGALLVTSIGYRWALHRSQPVFADTFALPTTQHIDRRLVFGSMLFGIGWGLAGFCPGPAVTALASGVPAVVLFLAAMLLGMWIESKLPKQRQP